MNEYIEYGIICLYGITIVTAFCEHFFISFKPYTKQNFLCLLLLSFFLALFATFRDGGVDYSTYSSIFDEIPSTWSILNNGTEQISDLPIESGYVFINSIVKMFFDDPIFVYMFMAFSSVFLYFFTFRKFSCAPCLSFLAYFSLLFIFKEAGQIRHGLACAVILYSIRYVYSKELKKFLCVIFMGMTFHLASILGILLYFINKIKWTRKKIFLIIVFNLILINISWIYNVINLLSEQGLLYYRIAAYQGDTFAQRDVSIIKYLSHMFLLIIFTIKKDYLRKYTPIYNLLLGMLCVGVLIQGFFYEFKELADRLSIGFYTSEFLLLPLLTKFPKRGGVTFLCLIIFFVIFFYRTWQWMSNTTGI